jgi:hypothetical protein
MTEIIGSAAYINWVGTGGTVVLGADYRTFSWVETCEQYDATAGSDTTRVYLPGFKTFTCSYTGVGQSKGTAIESALRAGEIGTVNFWPEGTGTGFRVYAFPCIVTKSPYNAWAYNAVVETSIEWQSNGAGSLGTT